MSQNDEEPKGWDPANSRFALELHGAENGAAIYFCWVDGIILTRPMEKSGKVILEGCVIRHPNPAVPPPWR